MKRLFKYLGGILLAILILLILVVFLLYLPPVQNFLRTKAVDYVSQNYHLDVKIGHFRLGFPLNLSLEDVYIGRNSTDTLVAVKSLRLNVGLKRIFRKELSVEELSLQQVKFGLVNDTSGMNLQVNVAELGLQARRIDLAKKWVEIGDLSLTNGSVSLTTGKSSIPDTTAAAPFDWTFLVDRIHLQQVEYRMNTATLPYLGAGIAGGDITRGKIMLGQQLVEVDSVSIDKGWCSMEMAANVQDTTKEVSRDTVTSWVVRANALHMENSAFSMLSESAGKTDIILSGIAVGLDSVYNRGTIVHGKLRDLRAVQKDGLRLDSMRADIFLDSVRTALNGVYIQTPDSRIRLEASSDTSLTQLMKRVPLLVRLDAQIGLGDLTPFYQGIPVSLRKNKVSLNTVLALTEDRIQVDMLKCSMPGRFQFSGKGRLSSLRDLNRVSGELELKGDFPDITFLQQILGDTTVRIPRNITLSASLKARQGELTSLLRLCCGEGCLNLDGSYHLVKEVYDGELTLNAFPLEQFLPQDSLGSVSATVRLSGSHFDWLTAKAELALDIRQFLFRGHDYRDFSLRTSLDRTRIQGTLTNKDKDTPVDLIFKGDSLGQEYVATLVGRIGDIDLKALNLAPEPLTTALNLDVRASMGPEETYDLNVSLDSLKITDAKNTYALGSLKLDMKSNRTKTALGMYTGDLQLKFQTDTSLMGFVGAAGKVAQIIGQQITEKDVNMEILKEDMPDFSFRLEGAQDNAVARFLKTRNIGFKNLAFDMVSRKRSGLRLSFLAGRPYFGTVRLDSVQAGVWQTGKSLVYAVTAGSSAESWKGLFNVNMSGRMQGNEFRWELKQKDAQGQIGFDMGVNLVMRDSAFTVSFFPMNPILGYTRWIVNADNRIVVGKDWKVDADLRMAYLNKLVSIHSLENEGDKRDRLQIEIAGVDLTNLARMVPFMPELAGTLNTDLRLYSKDEAYGVDGEVKLVDLFYDQQRVGTVDLELQYAGNTSMTDHAVDFELNIDSIKRAVARGTFSTSETKRDLMLDMDIPSLPLYIVNAFVPPGLIRLAGELNGNLHFRGTVDKPQLNGEVAFRNGKADVVMLGTTFSLDTTRLLVEDGKIVFRKYRFIAPNNSDLMVNGQIILTPFDRMSMDLAFNANNFEVVNVKKNQTSLIYGKAYANINSRLAGEFSALSVTGNVDLLNRTNITYTLRSSGPELVDKSADLVRFVSFRDSTLNEKDELTNRVNASSFVLRMLIEIGDQVGVNVELSEDGSNNVSIQGGGNLVLTMNPESGMSLSGKYILSGGTVVYNVPIAGKKEFSIQTGSYVEWTGNVMDPMLNISASEAVKATVEDGERNRLVTFESIIRIQNTLTRPDITFDLSAPSDMVIQNQLATFSQEERTRQALNLLIYNTYTAPGAAKSGSGGNMANNALYSLVENELNRYTKKIGLTVGVDEYNTDENTVQRDFTYQFSKQLFNDRVRVKIGGRVSTDNGETQSNNIQDNLVDDISIEYVLTKKRNLYIKVFRHSNYESVLDGEVTQTGVGIVWRKSFRKFKDLFKNNRKLQERKPKE